jgi:hypothetical protein
MDDRQGVEGTSRSFLEPATPLPPCRRTAVTIGIIMGLFLAAIEQTVVATAMPTVVSSLGGLNIILLAAQNTVPPRLMGTATSANLFFRTIGGSVGVAVMGSVMARRMAAFLGGTRDPQLLELAANPDAIVSETTRTALTPEALGWLRTALAGSLESVFLVGAGIAVLAFLLSLAFPAGSAEALAHGRGEVER